MSYFSVGGQIRSRRRYGGSKTLTFREIQNAIIALSAPEGGQTPLPTSMGGHGRICPPGSAVGKVELSDFFDFAYGCGGGRRREDYGVHISLFSVHNSILRPRPPKSFYYIMHT